MKIVEDIMAIQKNAPVSPFSCPKTLRDFEPRLTSSAELGVAFGFVLFSFLKVGAIVGCGGEILDRAAKAKSLVLYQVLLSYSRSSLKTCGGSPSLIAMGVAWNPCSRKSMRGLGSHTWAGCQLRGHIHTRTTGGQNVYCSNAVYIQILITGI